jgi:hypothetical protein
MIGQFFDEYWMFVEALLAHASDLLGVSVVNQLAASFGYPFAAALVLSCAGFALAWMFLSLGRPGWGLLGLAVGEELSALSLANAALAHGFTLDLSIAAARLAALVLAVCLVSAMLRKTLRLSPEKAPAARRIPPAW